MVRFLCWVPCQESSCHVDRLMMVRFLSQDGTGSALFFLVRSILAGTLGAGGCGGGGVGVGCGLIDFQH